LPARENLKNYEMFFLWILIVASALAIPNKEKLEESLFDLTEKELEYFVLDKSAPALRVKEGPVNPTICRNSTTGLKYKISEDSSCEAFIKVNEKQNTEKLIFRTKKDQIASCAVKFSMANPGIMVIRKTRMKKVKTVWDQDVDSLTFTGAANVETKLDMGSAKNFKMFVEGGSSSIVFKTEDNEARTGAAFALAIQPKILGCHQHIFAPAGIVGRITTPGFDRKKNRGYKKNTFCEWRIKAPEGHKIRVKFNNFNIGQNVDECTGEDFVAVDADGDGNFSKKERNCGGEEDIPKDIISISNEINVLAYGPEGGVGFCFNYIVEKVVGK